MDGDAGLTKAQLAEKVARADNSCTNLDATVQACLDAGKLQWAPAFDQQLLVPVTILDRLKAGFRAPVSDDTQPVQDFHSLAGLQAASSKHCQDKTNEMHVAANDAHQQPTATETVGVAQTVNDRDIGLSDLQQTGNSAGASTDNCATRAESGDVTRALMPAQQQQQHSDGAEQSQSEAACGSLLRPWSDHTGALNEPYWAALIQRVMSVVMRNPGILFVCKGVPLLHLLCSNFWGDSTARHLHAHCLLHAGHVYEVLLGYCHYLHVICVRTVHKHCIKSC